MAMILAAYLRKNYSNYILLKTYVNKIFRWRQFIRTPYSIREYSTSPLGVQVYTQVFSSLCTGLVLDTVGNYYIVQIIY